MKIFMAILISAFLGIALFVRVMMIVFQSNSITCWVDGKVVYCGPAYGASVESSGAATMLSISGSGFFDVIQKQVYVSKDIVVNPTH